MNSTTATRNRIGNRNETNASVATQSTVFSDKIGTHHLCRRAIVYVRQSTQHQVLEHRESSARQYALVDRAIALGWHREDVEVIDEDQGLSGSSIVGRNGFQRLLTEISGDRVGIVLGLEMSRLARSCKDWHALLELCGIYQTLLADADGLYDPAQYNDRLLLGLKGTMSEAELHILKSRMHQGMWNKASRGEILNQPPIGYIRSFKARDGEGDYIIDPDEQVRSVVRIVFERFERLGSINALLRWMVSNDIKLPIRPHFGSDRGELQWRRPNRVTLTNMLHHPIYAGAYRWGHREIDARKKVPGNSRTGRTLKSHDECRVLIHDRFEAYINWETFEKIQAIMQENSHISHVMSAPRHGPSVLAGLVTCGRCSHRMLVQYANKVNDEASGTLRYSCQRDAIDYGGPRCQSLSGEVLEAFVIERLMQVVTPASLELSMIAAADVERQRKQLHEHWKQRLARSRYEVEQSRKSYAVVDPEHRLVARELERRWNEALRADEKLRKEYDRFQSEQPTALTEQDRLKIRSLTEAMPELWRAPSTKPEDRCAIARMLLEQIVVNIDGDSERLDVDIYWVGGFRSHHRLRRPVQTYEQLSYYDELFKRIQSLIAEKHTLGAIADQLNKEGYIPPKRSTKFTNGILTRFLRDRGIHTGRLPKSVTEENHLTTNEWWIGDLATKLQMPIATLHSWQRVGWVTSRKVIATNRWAVFADADELKRLDELRSTKRGWPDYYPRHLITPKANPNSSLGEAKG